MKVAVIIPARYSSSRFPAKVVHKIAGKSMVRRVWERVNKSKRVDEVIIATDDDRVASEVHSFGGVAMMTSPDHRSGTERCAEAAEKLNAQVIVNVQGDEPLFHPDNIGLVAEPFFQDDSVSMTSLRHPLDSYEDYLNPNVVKVVSDVQDNAIYFSRHPLPYYRDGKALLEKWEREGTRPAELLPVPMKHLGVYAYRAEFLQALVRMPRTEIEDAEMLEQLRVLSWGFKIRMVTTKHDSIGVDVPADAEKVERLILSRGDA